MPWKAGTWNYSEFGSSFSKNSGRRMTAVCRKLLIGLKWPFQLCIGFGNKLMWIKILILPLSALPQWQNSKEFTCSAGAKGDGLDPWVRKIPWRRAGNPLQYSCPENPMDRGAWWAAAHGVATSWTWLSTHTLQFLYPDSSSWLQLLSLLRSEASPGGFI